MLSFFTDNNNLNACQKLEKNLRFACLRFLLNPSSPQPPPCPFPKCVQKIKSVRNLCAMSPVFSGSEKIWVYKDSRWHLPAFQDKLWSWSPLLQRSLIQTQWLCQEDSDYFCTQTNWQCSEPLCAEILDSHSYASGSVSHFKWHRLIWLLNEKTKYHEQMKR